MAGTCITPPCLLRLSTPSTLLSRKPLLLASALTTPRRRKFAKRKNYLRPKILKTTTKPYIKPQNEPITPLETPIQHTHISPSDEVAKAPENQGLLLSEVSEPEAIVNDTESTFYETPIQQTHILDSDLAAGDDLKTSENREFRLSEVSDPSGAVNAVAGTFGKGSLLKFGLWIVGAFVFQTVCAVWVFGSADYSGKNKSSDGNGYKNEVLELDLKGTSKHKLRMFVNGDGNQSIENGGTVFVDEDEMEKKIEEIQHMAREAREKERLELKGNDVDEEQEEEIEDSDVKMGIKKEVDERLIKLRKRLGKVSNKQPTNSVTFPTVDVNKNVWDDGGTLDEKELSASLTFKRKQKFREFASKPSNKPKGFMALDHQSVGTNGDKTLEDNTEVKKNGNREGGVDVSGDDEVDLLTLDSHRGAFVKFGENIESKGNTKDAESVSPLSVKKSSENKGRGRKERSVKKVEGGKADVIKAVKKNSLEKSGRKKKGIASDLEESKPRIDILVDRNNGSSLFEPVDSKELNNQETATISNTGNTLVEVMDSGESRRIKSTTMMNRRKNSNRNGTSNMKEVKDQKVVNPKEGTNSGNDTDFWWFSLPYVLAIRMRRGHDDEGPEGLFTLKSSSQVNGSLSHTVTFEDRGDATNFCYLLQSFFEDLGDFSAEIVPLPVKELSEAIRSHTMKVIVVKKGKLKLYAGQPLADAEMALRSMVEQE
ncbi:uncharacterized protein LOC125858870 isoform X2 [Solanum stenotomum]|uniref:uncharacterized protein LOC125858870 isoform X2 n=1 Tax=Solanum stenotomum TaxID=172797 RepID=UPI0020D17946|nr:uncharacterized protein LOC125858870 isoform X2 [Solanum stenotomum]